MAQLQIKTLVIVGDPDPLNMDALQYVLQVEGLLSRSGMYWVHFCHSAETLPLPSYEMVCIWSFDRINEILGPLQSKFPTILYLWQDGHPELKLSESLVIPIHVGPEACDEIMKVLNVSPEPVQ